MRFAPEYISSVLTENFEDAKELLLAPLMAIHYAHLVMLAEQRIVTVDDARALRAALDGIALDSVRSAAYDGSCEDLFFFIERLIRDVVRRRRRGPASHGAQPQRHRHDDVPDASARVRRAAGACGCSNFATR